MKRIVVLFLTILLVKTICFSATTSKVINQDSTVLITSNQLKYANLIFVEHEKLLKENNLLNQQVENYKVKTDLLLKTDSLRISQIVNYQNINKTYVDQIEDLNKTIRNKDRMSNYWKIGGITVGAGMILFLLLK